MAFEIIVTMATPQLEGKTKQVQLLTRDFLNKEIMVGSSISAITTYFRIL
jgi:hypothetical protein